MPSDDFDESTDPLTAPLWPVSEAAEILKFDPANEERPESSTPSMAVPKPPDVDAILRGEYTGWVPVIKAGESLVDAQERAAAKIRRIEAEIDAADLDGAHSVSMWIPFNSGAVPLPPQVTNVPPAPKAPPTIVIPARPVEQVPTGEFTRMIPDPDQVLSPADALDEARRRIRQMREDLESNVQMVTRSFEHGFFAVPEDDSESEPAFDAVIAAVDEANDAVGQVGPSDGSDANLSAHFMAEPTDEPWQPTATAVVRLQRRTMEDIADEIEAAIDANDARIGEHVVNAHKLRERLAQQRDEVARKVAAMSSATLSRDVLEAMNLETSVESVNGVPVIGQDADEDPSLEPMNADRPARVTLDEGLVTAPADISVDAGGSNETTSEVDEPLDEVVVMPAESVGIGDVASDVDEEIEDAVIVEPVPSTPVVPAAREWAATPAPVAPGGIGGDSEAKFLGDLLDSLADVEAAVTAVVNSTALDDVLAKYKDILEADTSSATAADLETAAEVEAMVAETRVDIDAMIRGLKAAAETFSDTDAGQGVAEAASVLEGILTAGPGDVVLDAEVVNVAALEDATADTSANAAETLVAPDPLAAVADEVARMRAAALAAIGLNEDLEPLPDVEVSGTPEGESTVAAEIAAEDDDQPGEPTANTAWAVEDADDTVVADDEPVARTTSEDRVTEAPRVEAHEPDADAAVETGDTQSVAVNEPSTEPSPKAPVEPDLVSLVDSALKPISLPPIFRGEPRRMSTQDQLDALGGTVPNMTPPRPRQKPMPPRKVASAPASDASTTAPAPAAVPAPAPVVPVDEDLVPGGRRANTAEEFEIDQIIAAAARPSAPASFWDDDEGDSVLDASAIMGRSAPRASQPTAASPAPGETIAVDGPTEPAPVNVAVSLPSHKPVPDTADILQDIPSADSGADGVPASQVAAEVPVPPAESRSDAVSRRIADESIFNAAANSPTAATYVLNEQASKDHSLELVIMRDEIRDLRDRLDSSQRLIEDLMIRLAQLTEIALKQRSN